LLLVILLGATAIIGPYFRPRFRISIEWLAFGKTGAGVTVAHTVVAAHNTGMNSTLDNWRMYVTPQGGKEIAATRVALIKPTTLSTPTHKQVWEPEDWIMNKGAERPIPRGGRVTGVFIARIDGISPENLGRPGTLIRIVANDCFRHEHSFQMEWSVGKGMDSHVFSGMKSPPAEKIVPAEDAKAPGVAS
jgi:hypothetical protein